VQREQLEAQIVDFDVELVERYVAIQHLVDQLVIAVDQPLHCGAHAFFSEAAHREQALFQRLELLLKMVTFH
jgi:hypothetical protein